MNEQWEVKQHSWREIGIYSSTRRITMIDVENSFDVSEDNQDECERKALRHAHLIATAPELLNAIEDMIKDLKLRAEIDSQGYRVLNISDSVLRRAEKAIAKAKGEL